MANNRPMNRAERAVKLLRRGWMSSWDMIHQCGTVCPSKVRSEVRQMGVTLETRRFAGVQEYRVKK